jgi:hypothetical protein
MIVKDSVLTDDGWRVDLSLEDEGKDASTTVLLPTWRAGSPHAAGLLAMAEAGEWADKARAPVAKRTVARGEVVKPVAAKAKRAKGSWQ